MPDYVPQVRQPPMARPEILEIKADEVHPFDHLEEGRMVITIEWRTDQPANTIDITTAITEIELDEGTGLRIPHFRDHRTERYEMDQLVTVIRNLPVVNEKATKRITLTTTSDTARTRTQMATYGEIRFTPLNPGA